LRVVQRGVGGDAARCGEACAVARRASGVGEWLSRACSSTVGLTRWGVEGWRRGARVLVLALRVVRWGVGGDAARGGEACAAARRASGVGEWLSRACSSTAGLTQRGVEGGVEGRGVGGASAGSARRGCWCWWGMRSGELVLVRRLSWWCWAELGVFHRSWAGVSGALEAVCWYVPGLVGRLMGCTTRR
jgi:hypothetical protein